MGTHHKLVLNALILTYLTIVVVATLEPFQFQIPPVLRTRIFPPPEWSTPDGMVFRGTGAFGYEEPVREIADAIETANAFYIYAELQPERARQSGPARIVTYSLSVSYQAFLLGQSGGELVVRLADPSRDRTRFMGHVYLFGARLSTESPNHVLVTVTPEALSLYCNGTLVDRYLDPVFEPGTWSRSCRLVAGNGPELIRPWRGRLRTLVIGSGPPPRHVVDAALVSPDAAFVVADTTESSRDGVTQSRTLLALDAGTSPPTGWAAITVPAGGAPKMPWSLRPFNEPVSRQWAREDWLRNAILLLPLGVLLALRRFRPVPIGLAVLLVSLTIELTQLFLPARYTQTTDLILNVAGGLFGAIVARRIDAVRLKRRTA